jgi:signal transduction histidine kinase
MPTTPLPEASLELLRDLIEDISGELELAPLFERIVAHACRLAGAECGSLGLHDIDTDTIRTVARFHLPADQRPNEPDPGVGLYGQVQTQLAPVFVRRGSLVAGVATAGTQYHGLAVPVLWKEELIGVIAVGATAPHELAPHALEGLTRYARHAAIAIENARRYARERRRTARFELIARVARIINAGLAAQPLLQQAADAIHDVLEFPNVDIPLLDPADPQTLLVAIRGGDYKRQIRGEERLPISHGIMGAAVRERRSQRIDDVRRDPRYVQPPTSGRMQAELAVPILLGEEVLGVVNVEGETPFDALDQRTLEIVADHLAIALRNLELIDMARAAAVSEERQRLARELHDSVTQILSSISLLAQSLSAAWRTSPADGERRAQRLAELSQAALAEMRKLLRELLPPSTRVSSVSLNNPGFLGLERLKQGGLAVALPRLLEVMAPEQLELQQDFTGYVAQSLAHEEALFRVCQEAVSNVVRHAGARRLEVAARVEPNWVQLSIRDDGCGLAPARGESGIGLKSMRLRVARLGGSVELRPALPSGTEERARLPRLDRVLEP